MPVTSHQMLIGAAMNFAANAYLPPAGPAVSPWRMNGVNFALTSNQLLYVAKMASKEFTYQRRGMPGQGWVQVTPPKGVVLNQNRFMPGGMMGGMGGMMGGMGGMQGGMILCIGRMRR